jgi:hypothetical protein
MAAGIDCIVLLVVGAKNLREVALFPMNQQANDLLMGAPCWVQGNSIFRPLLRRPRNRISAGAVPMSGVFTRRREAKSCLTHSRKDPGHPDRASLETDSVNA